MNYFTHFDRQVPNVAFTNFTIDVFAFIFAVFMKQLTFLVVNFNRKLEAEMDSGMMTDLEEFFGFHKCFLVMIDRFHEIFHLQICVFVANAIVKLVMIVSASG